MESANELKDKINHLKVRREVLHEMLEEHQWNDTYISQRIKSNDKMILEYTKELSMIE